MTGLPSGLAAFAPATVAAGIIAVYLFLGEPVVGLVLHRRFERDVVVDPTARRWLYGRLLLLEWGLVVLVLAVLAVADDLAPAAYGLRLPHGGLAWSVTAAVVVVALVLVVVTVRVARALRRESPGPTVQRLLGAETVVSMLPRTTRERRLFTGVAVTAGIAEELVYRGFLIAVLAALLPSWPLVVWCAVAVVGFGLAHAYQGAGGIVATMLVGAVLTVLYVTTGSLLAPVVLHACIDLRAIPLGRLLGPRSRAATESWRTA